MKVYIVRHGQSENNINKLWTGWMDSPLTEKGEEEARQASRFFEHISVNKVYTSDLVRAIKTAQIAIPDCSYEVSRSLREINVGSLAGKPLPIMTAEERAIVKNRGYEIFDGESLEDFGARIADFKKTLEGLDCKAVAIFTHRGWLLAFLRLVIGNAVKKENIVCNNCAIGVFEFKDSTWKLHSWINSDEIY